MPKTIVKLKQIDDIPLSKIAQSSATTNGVPTWNGSAWVATVPFYNNVTAARLIGRGAGTAGIAQEITPGTGLSFSGVTLNVTETDPVYTAAIPGILMVKTQIPSGADLNTYQTTGIYTQTGDANAAAGTNYPAPYAGKLEVVFDNNVKVYQTYHIYGTASVALRGIYRREYYNGTWTPWAKIIDTEGTSTLLAPYELLANKASNWTTINNIKYPTTAAVQAQFYNSPLSITQNQVYNITDPTHWDLSPAGTDWTWHDTFAFGASGLRNQYETTTDFGTTWTAQGATATAFKMLTQQKQNLVAVGLTNTSGVTNGFRCTFSNLAFSVLSYLHLHMAYTSPACNIDYIVESSSDNATWTTLTSNTNFVVNNSTGGTVIRLNTAPVTSYVRITIIVNTSSTAASTLNVTALRGMALRGGSGWGKEYEYPYYWNANGNMGINMLKIGALSDPGFLLDVVQGTVASTTPIAVFSQNGGAIQIGNSTSSANSFEPVLRGVNVLSGFAGISIVGQGANSYGTAAVLIRGANAGYTGVVTSGKLFSVQNYTTEYFSISATGTVNIPSLATVGGGISYSVFTDATGNLGKRGFASFAAQSSIDYNNLSTVGEFAFIGPTGAVNAPNSAYNYYMGFGGGDVAGRGAQLAISHNGTSSEPVFNFRTFYAASSSFGWVQLATVNMLTAGYIKNQTTVQTAANAYIDGNYTTNGGFFKDIPGAATTPIKIIKFPSGGHYTTATQSPVGAFVISHNEITSTMVTMVIKMVDYSTSADPITIKVFSYSIDGISFITNKGAIIEGNNRFANLIRLGYNATGQRCVIIGDVTTSYTAGYNRLYIEEVTLNYTGAANASWNTGWNITLETDLSTYTGLVTLTSRKVLTSLDDVGATNFIQNQTSVIQTANARITGYIEAGKMSMGNFAPPANINFYNNAPITGGASSVAHQINAAIQSDVTTGTGYSTLISTAAATFTTNITHFLANQGTINAGSVVTTQIGFQAANGLSGATNNYGFWGQLASSGSNNWNLYMTGNAPNFLNGKVGFGTTSLTTNNFRSSLTVTGNTSINTHQFDGTIQSDVTNSVNNIYSVLNTQAATFSVTFAHFLAAQGVIGAGSTINTQTGFWVNSSLISATTNYGFRGQIPIATGRWNIFMDGTASNHMAGNLYLGGTNPNGWIANFVNTKSITGATAVYANVSDATIQSDVTNTATYYRSQSATAAATFTLTQLNHFVASQATFGAGSTVTTQHGFLVSPMAGAVTNIAFRGQIASSATNWNLYMDGTAWNYLGSRLGIGSQALTNVTLRNSLSLTGNTAMYGHFSDPTVIADVTGSAYIFTSAPATQAATFTLGLLGHYVAQQGVFGAGSVVTTQVGFTAASTLIGAGTNIGFRGQLPSGTNRYNFYADGTAQNYFAGNVGIGTTSTPIYKLHVTAGTIASTTALVSFEQNNGYFRVGSDNPGSGIFQPTVYALSNDTNTGLAFKSLNSGGNAQAAFYFSAQTSASGTLTAGNTFKLRNNVTDQLIVDFNGIVTIGNLAGGGSTIVVSSNAGVLSNVAVLPIVNGGTGLTSPGAIGNVLTSTGTTWVSSAPPFVTSNIYTADGTLTNDRTLSAAGYNLTFTGYNTFKVLWDGSNYMTHGAGGLFIEKDNVSGANTLSFTSNGLSTNTASGSGYGAYQLFGSSFYFYLQDGSGNNASLNAQPTNLNFSVNTGGQIAINNSTGVAISSLGALNGVSIKSPNAILIDSPSIYDTTNHAFGFKVNNTANNTIGAISLYDTVSTKYASITSSTVDSNWRGGIDFISGSVNSDYGITTAQPFVQFAVDPGNNGASGSMLMRVYNFDTSTYNYLIFGNASSKAWSFPNASGVIALQSDVTALNLQAVATVGNTYTGDLKLGTGIVGSEIFVGNGGVASGNTRLGYQTLIANIDGNWNTAIGSQAMMSLQHSPNNTAIGEFAMVQYVGSTTNSGNNTAIGDSAFNNITDGLSNTAIGVATAGSQSLRNAGQNNTFIGSYAGNTQMPVGVLPAGNYGNYNILIGSGAGGGIDTMLLSYQLRIGIRSTGSELHFIEGDMTPGAMKLKLNSTVFIANVASTSPVSTSQYLVRDPSTNEIKYVGGTSMPNIYNSDGTLTASRTLNGNTLNFGFINIGTYFVQSSAMQLSGNTGLVEGFVDLFLTSANPIRITSDDSSTMAYLDTSTIGGSATYHFPAQAGTFALYENQVIGASVTGTTTKTLSLTLGGGGAPISTSWTDLSGTGTVTSVAMSIPTGFAITGSPITTSGTLALGFASGYSLPTTATQNNWQTAYTWYVANNLYYGNYSATNTDITALVPGSTAGALIKSASNHIVVAINGNDAQDSFNILSNASTVGNDPMTLNVFKIVQNGTVTIKSLAGTGTRVVVSDANGVLSNAALTSGTVTSVGLSLPSIFTITGSPVTSTGTLTGTLASQTALTVFAVGSVAAAPSFQLLTAAHIPVLDASKVTTGVFAVARLGTGTPSTSTYLRGDGAWITAPWLTANQSITLTGQVTGTGTTSIATTITAGTVTYAQIQNVTQGVLLGRSVASAGSVQEIALGTNLSYTGTTLNATFTTPTLQQVTTAGATTSINTSFTGQVNFGGSSNLVINATGNMVPGTTNLRSAGYYGVYDSTRIAHIWSIGTGFKIADDGSTFGGTAGTGQYGLSYIYQTHTLAPRSTGAHQIAFVANGTATGSISLTDGKYMATAYAGTGNRIVYADATGVLQVSTTDVSNGFILNQNASPQTGNAWVSGRLLGGSSTFYGALNDGGYALSAVQTGTTAGTTSFRMANASVGIYGYLDSSGGGFTNATTYTNGAMVYIAGATTAATVNHYIGGTLTSLTNNLGIKLGQSAGRYQMSDSSYLSGTNTYWGFQTSSNGALPIKAGSLVLSDSFTDVAPTNGLFVKGGIQLAKVSNAFSGAISFYSTTYKAWTIYMANAGTTTNGVNGNITAPSGSIVTGFAMRSFVEATAGMGWIFESGTSAGNPTVIAELTSDTGNFRTLGHVSSGEWFRSRNTGTGWFNEANTAGIMSIVSNEVRVYTGNRFRVGDTGNGYITLEQGSSIFPGYAAFYNPNGTRNGYIGANSSFDNGTGLMNYVAEQGSHRFVGNGTNTIMTLTATNTNQTELLFMGNVTLGASLSYTLANTSGLQSSFVANIANAWLTGTAAGDSGVRFSNTYFWGPSSGSTPYMAINSSRLIVNTPIIPANTTVAANTGSWNVLVKDISTSQMMTIDSSWISGGVDQWWDPMGYQHIGAQSLGYGNGLGIDSQGGYSSRDWEVTANAQSVPDGCEFVYRWNDAITGPNPQGTPWNLTLPNPTSYPHRVLTIKNLSIGATASLTFVTYIPIRSSDGATTASLAAIKAAAGTPCWIQVKSVFVTSIGGWRWIVFKHGFADN